MAINYSEKGAGLHAAIAAAGHWLSQVDGVWRSSNVVAVQAVIDGYNELPYYKAGKIAAIKNDGLARIQAVFPAIGDFDELSLVREMYLSVAPAARSPTSSWQRMIDIYTAGRAAVTAVSAATTKAQVDAVVPSWPA